MRIRTGCAMLLGIGHGVACSWHGPDSGHGNVAAALPFSQLHLLNDLTIAARQGLVAASLLLAIGACAQAVVSGTDGRDRTIDSQQRRQRAGW